VNAIEVTQRNPVGGLAREVARSGNITFRLAIKNPEAFTVRVFVIPASISG
jgi:hypothetical protein